MLRYLRKRYYRRNAPKETARLPVGGVKWSRHIALNLETGKPIAEWWTRDPKLPLRFEMNVRIRPRGEQRS